MSTVTCTSPIDGTEYATRKCLTLDAARAAIARARTAQVEWRARPLAERVDLVMKGVAEVGRTKDRMTTELAHQMGRPVRYGGEFGGLDERASYMAGIAADTLAPTVVEDSDAALRKIEHIPHGVVFVVAPWNYPYMTANNTIAPALMAGNVVIHKGASQTILVGEHLADAYTAAGIPADVFQNIVLDHATTSALIAENAFDFINFTGSVGGGAAMETAAAGTFTGVATELGGKDPGYVRADADVQKAVDILMDGAMFNAGQCCCGIERIYVHESLFDDFVGKAVDWVNALTLGNPLEEATTLGPMANIRFAKEVRAQVDEAIADGAIAHIAPMPADDGGIYLTPQILTNVSHDMRVMRDETFGPVVGIMAVKDDDEAIALMNDCQFGLTSVIVTNDTDAAIAIGDRLETGTVLLNRADYLDPALCWTGCKNTGRGQGLSDLGFRALTRPKSYHLKKS